MALDLIVIAAAIALDPFPLTVFGVVLSSKNGLKKGAAFLLGWVLSLVAVVAVTVLATGNSPPRSSTAPAVAALAVKLLLGVVLVGFGVRQQRRRRRPHPPKKAPKWQASVDSMSMLYAAGLAALSQPMALIGAGVATITAAKISSVADALVLVAFCLVASSTLIGLELYAKLRPERADRVLKRALAWLERNTEVLVVIGSIAVGLYLTGSSVYHLATGSG